MQQFNSILLQNPGLMAPAIQKLVITVSAVSFVLWLFALACGWRLFVKAGVAGWKSLIPVYGAICQYRIIYGRGLYLLLCLAPVFGQLFMVYSVYKQARAYGAGRLFSFANIFFRPVTSAIMAFGKNTYIGPQPLWGYSRSEYAAAKPRKYAKKYITYDGYNEELQIFCKGGRYFRFYKLRDTGFHENQAAAMLADRDLKYQVLCSSKGSFLVAGLKAPEAGAAAKKLKEYEEKIQSFAERQPCSAWFEYMSGRIRMEDFAGFPELVTTKKGKVKKRNRKETAIEKLQPFDLKNLQTKMEISGKETKTIIFVNFPSQMFEAFATELIKIEENITVSVFAEIVDKDKCLRGVGQMKDIRPARKKAMTAYLEKHIKNGTELYNTGILVNITGSPETIEETYGKVVRYCTKYLISVNQLDYQQSDGFISTLPMLDNRIRYHRVMDLVNLQAFLPWSRLHDIERTVSYGRNAFDGEVFYDRYANRESGFIVAADYGWCLKEAGRELAVQIEKDQSFREKVEIISTGSGNGQHFTLDVTDPQQSNKTILAEAVKEWAIDALSVGGRSFSKDVNAVFLAVEKTAEETGDLKSFMARFLEKLPEEEREKISEREFKTEYEYCREETEFGKRLYSRETGAFADVAYTLLMHNVRLGVAVSLNTELLVMEYGAAFEMRQGVLYTFLSPDLRRLYDSKLFEETLADRCTYFYIGEHHIAEKIRLAAAVGLNKEQRTVIAAPARANVVITELCDFIIPVEREEDEEKEAV